jgi:hypothetical protein
VLERHVAASKAGSEASPTVSKDRIDFFQKVVVDIKNLPRRSDVAAHMTLLLRFAIEGAGAQPRTRRDGGRDFFEHPHPCD